MTKTKFESIPLLVNKQIVSEIQFIVTGSTSPTETTISTTGKNKKIVSEIQFFVTRSTSPTETTTYTTGKNDVIRSGIN